MCSFYSQSPYGLSTCCIPCFFCLVSRQVGTIVQVVSWGIQFVGHGVFEVSLLLIFAQMWFHVLCKVLLNLLYPSLCCNCLIVHSVVIFYCYLQGRAPALLDNLFQAIFMAPLFVLLEVRLCKVASLLPMCPWALLSLGCCVLFLSLHPRKSSNSVKGIIIDFPFIILNCLAASIRAVWIRTRCWLSQTS